MSLASAKYMKKAPESSRRPQDMAEQQEEGVMTTDRLSINSY